MWNYNASIEKLLLQFVELGVDVQVLLYGDEVAMHGTPKPGPIDGIFSLTMQSDQNDGIVEAFFAVDRVVWIIPDSTPLRSALTDEEKRNLGLD